MPIFLTYVLSFVFLGIYWNNHHHMLHAAERINGKVLWANLHLLFWLSLVPFVTGWMGQNHFAPIPTRGLRHRDAVRGDRVHILAHTLIAEQGPDSRLARAFGRDRRARCRWCSGRSASGWRSSTRGSRSRFTSASR